MPKYHGPDPVVEITGVTEIARDLVVVPNRHIDLVPNIGVIGGTHSVLIVETGMGPRNAAKVLKFAADYAKGRHLSLTTTHFHPEHAFGAQAFAGEATYLANRAQADDLAARGAGYLDMFRAMGEPVARQLEGVKLTTPDVVYDGSCDLDLGDRVVHFTAHWPGPYQGRPGGDGPRRRGDVHRRPGGDRPVLDLPLVPALRHRCVGGAMDCRDAAAHRREPPGCRARPR